MRINSKQRAEIERILSNWNKYLDSLPPASDDLKLHKWLGMNTSLVKKDDFSNNLRSFANELRARLNASPEVGSLLWTSQRQN